MLRVSASPAEEKVRSDTATTGKHIEDTVNVIALELLPREEFRVLLHLSLIHISEPTSPY